MATPILLVDDDPVTRRVIERVIATEPRLRAMDARVLPAPDGREGLALLEAERPALVITDLYMPGMDGFAFCREVRRSRAGQGLPILMISGVYDDAQLAGGLRAELGATFLAKPLAARALVDAILAAMPAAGATSGGAGAAPNGVHDTLPETNGTSPAPVAAGNSTTGPDLVAVAETGSLADRSFPRLLFDYMELQATGVLTLMRAQMKKEIYLRNGKAISADSNLRQEALGSLLVAKRVIDDAQLQFLLAESKRRGQKMGTVLVELGWLTPEDVLQYLAAQARKRIADCLRWREGSWTFVPGDNFGDKVMEHDLDVPKIIFRGLLRTADFQEMVGRFDEDGARPVQLLPRLGAYRAAFEAVFGTEVLTLLAQGATLSSLVLRENGQALSLAVEALLICGLAELALTPREGDGRKTTDTVELFPLDKLGSAPRSGLGKTLRPAPEEAVATTGVSPAWASEPAPIPTRPQPEPSPERERSGEIRLYRTGGTEQGMGAVPGGEARAMRSTDTRTVLLREFLGLHGKSHYEVLGLRPDASQEEIAAAYQEKTAALSPEQVGAVDLGSDTAKVEAVRAAYDRAFKVLADPAARRDYDAPSEDAAAPPKTDALGAELAFGEGLRLLHDEQPAEAAAHFEQAVAARPDQAAYHAYLGWSLYQADQGQNMAAARERLDHALALDPDLAKAHELLGRVALDDGDLATARERLERAAELDPVQPDVVALLLGVFERLHNPRASEKVFRKLIAALGERALPLRQRLWRELAEIYDKKLGERESARIAYDMAARLSPSDVAMQRKVVELNAEDPARWREIARALATEWQHRPDDGSLGAELVGLFFKAGRHDAATVAAAVAVLRGQASNELVKLAQEGRSRLLRRLPTPLELSVAERVGSPGEDAQMETLFTMLVRAGVIEPLTSAEAGLEEQERLETDQQPSAFRRVLLYLCQLLGQEEPATVYRKSSLGSSARMADVRPQALVVGGTLLESSDAVELAFRLGRALAVGSPGRIAATSRTGRQLRPYMLATLAAARATTIELDENAEAVVRRIGRLDSASRKQVVSLCVTLTRGRSSLDLGAWVRAVNRTATRLALLISGDVMRVGQAVAQDDGPEALEDLLSFALSIEHLDLREELGIAAVI
jgi:CheY-like chemotaxis protein/tetratricopeptide (TPR) repeat protein